MRDFLTYGAYRLLGALTGPLPPKIGYRLAEKAGLLLCRTSPGLRRTLTHNMRRVLGPDADEERVQAVVRAVCQNIAKGHYDLFRVSRLSGQEILEVTEIEGWAHLDRALARKKGVILVSSHFGNVDLMAQVPVALGLKIMGPVQHVHPERLFRYTMKLRQSHGVKLIPADGVLLEMYRALRRGEIVGLPCDRGIAENSRMVEFFGKPALLADGPVRLALRTGAALVPGFAYRWPDNTFLVRIEPELELTRTSDLERDVADGMRQIIQILERVISQNPEQWLVAAPVWPMDELEADQPPGYRMDPLSPKDIEPCRS